jgi:hypothetical protein
MALALSTGSGIGFWRALPRAGCRPLHLGAGGLGASCAEYRPDPALYADLTWPPGADVDPGTPLGSRIFAQHCAVRHGPDGRGNGPAAPSMFPRPRDFSIGKFKYKSTGGAANRRRCLADDSRRPACQRDALLCRATLERGIGRRRGAGEVVFRSFFRARPPHRNPRRDPKLAGKRGPRKNPDRLSAADAPQPHAKLARSFTALDRLFRLDDHFPQASKLGRQHEPRGLAAESRP